MLAVDGLQKVFAHCATPEERGILNIAFLPERDHYIANGNAKFDTSLVSPKDDLKIYKELLDYASDDNSYAFMPTI